LSETENRFNILAVPKKALRDGLARARSATRARGRAGYAKSRATRARILAAALAEASRAGLHKASVSGIAARAGVAVGNLHYHFGSRRALLRELMGALVADLMPRLHAIDAEEGTDFFERQRAGLLVYLDYLRARPALVRLADEIKLHDPALYRRAVAGWVERMAAKIRAGIAEGTLRSMEEPEIAAQAHFLLGARHFLEPMMERPGGATPEAVVDAYLGLLRDGLGRRAPRPSSRERRR
jgi:AcrR family transcriptional regulator